MSYTRKEIADITQLALHRLAFSSPDSEASQDMRERAREALRQAEPVRVHRLNLPATAPEGEEEMYAALAAFGGTITHAEAGCVTELIRPDGIVAARVVPA